MVADALFGLFAVLMLVRNGPAALRAVRGERRAATLTAALNVLLALTILVFAVKGLVSRLI